VSVSVFEFVFVCGERARVRLAWRDPRTRSAHAGHPRTRTRTRSPLFWSSREPRRFF